MRGPNKRTVSLARNLRRQTTSAEARLWSMLRNRQLNGLKFIRQVPIGSYVVDFVCRDKQLVVEVDGATHSTEEELRHDLKRTTALESLSYRVIRVQNDDVYHAMEGVLQTIIEATELKQR